MSTSTPQPDIAGFASAQQRLRGALGRDVRFYAPAAMLYDPGVPALAFDDEGIPLDPLAGASAVNPDTTVALENLSYIGSAHVSVVFQPLAAMRRDETQEQAIAFRSRLNKDLICDINDRPIASGASHFEIGTLARDVNGNVIYPEQWTPDDGELWKVVNAKTDGIGGLQRYIIFGQGTL